jgi:hypothetical protein
MFSWSGWPLIVTLACCLCVGIYRYYLIGAIILMRVVQQSSPTGDLWTIFAQPSGLNVNDCVTDCGLL